MILVLAVPALAFSLFVYLFHRPTATVAPLLCMHLLGPERFLAIRHAVRGVVSLDSFSTYSLPEGLWILCLTLASVGMTLSVKRCSVPLALAPPLYAVGLEFAQLGGLVRGRFDPVDLAVSLSFWASGILFQAPLGSVRPLRADRRSLVLAGCWSIVYLAHVCA